MAEMNPIPCPFCGGRPHFTYWGSVCKWGVKHTCKGGTGNGKRFGISACDFETEEEALKAWNRRTKVETNIYNKEETYPNCTVQVLTNTVTGDVSVGWWKNGGNEDA